MSIRKPNRFAVLLDLAIAAAGFSEKTLLLAIGEAVTPKKKEAIRSWRRGGTYPRIGKYLRILEKIESHLKLEAGRLYGGLGTIGTLLAIEPSNMQCSA
jgi:hypothetical protein